MRYALFTAVLAVSFSASASDFVAKRDKDRVRLSQEACPVEVLKVIDQGQRGFFSRAYAQINGHDWSACWATLTDGNVLVVYSDGDMGLIPLGEFHQDDGV